MGHAEVFPRVCTSGQKAAGYDGPLVRVSLKLHAPVCPWTLHPRSPITREPRRLRSAFRYLAHASMHFWQLPVLAPQCRLHWSSSTKTRTWWFSMWSSQRGQ